MWIKKLLVLLVSLNFSSSLSNDFEPGGKPEIKIVNPEAEAVIGAVVNVRHHGTGLFGCGERKVDGVTSVDALTWTVDELNKKMWSGTSANISFGLCIMDSCSRTRIAASHLAEFLPELNGEEPRKEGQLKLGVIDAVGLEQEDDVSRTMQELNIPVIKSTMPILAPQQVVQTALELADELRWEQVAVVHSSSQYSLALLKALTRAMKKTDLCIPWIVNAENMEQDMKQVINSGIPILALLPSTEQNHLLDKFQNVSSKNTPVLFTDLVLRRNLIKAGQVKVYAMVTLPEREAHFEEFLVTQSINKGVRTEDELELAQRTQVARAVDHVVNKMATTLIKTKESLCRDKSQCRQLLTQEARNTFTELLSVSNYVSTSDFGLVLYQYQFPDGHVHLHKLMTYSHHKRHELFESPAPPILPGSSCEEDKAQPHCRCLEANNLRSESARHIGHDFERRQEISKSGPETEYIYTAPDIRPVDHATAQPSVYSALRDPLYATLAGLTLLGALVTLFTGQYFATSAALPHGGLTSGTSVLGYLILIGLFALFSANLSFVLTPSLATCGLRRFLPNVCFAVVYSGMMIKVWVSWRQTKSEKAESWKPRTLCLLSVGFTTLQVVLSGCWLLLLPPRVHLEVDRLECYPSGDLDSHLLLSMVYIVGLLFVTAVFAIRTCSQVNNSEARWILTSSALTAVVFSCWGVAVATGVWHSYRTPVTMFTAATILLLCLYVPKIRLHSQLKNSQPEVAQYPVSLDKEFPLFAARPAFPIMIDYDLPSPPVSTEPTESSFSNQAYSVDAGTATESMSIPFEIETSSFSELEPEQFTFSTFLDVDSQPHVVNDPTQVVPSSLYPLDMFSTEEDMPGAAAHEHCEPGTNEFTPAHRTSSQLYLCPAPDWVP